MVKDAIKYFVLTFALVTAFFDENLSGQDDPFEHGSYTDEFEISSEKEYSRTLFHFIQETQPKGCKLMFAQNYRGVFITVVRSPTGRAVVNTWVHNKSNKNDFAFNLFAREGNIWRDAKWIGIYNSKYRVFDESSKRGSDTLIRRMNGMVFSVDPKAKFTKLEFGMTGDQDLNVVIPWSRKVEKED